MRELVIIGIGNPWRRDDGVGPEVIRAIARCMPGVRTVTLTYPDPAVLLPLWQRVRTCIVVDAVACTYAPPGTIIRWFLGGEGFSMGNVRGVSTHGWRLGETLRLAFQMGCMPERMIVYGIVGETFAYGYGLSRRVARAVPLVVRWIRTDGYVTQRSSRRSATASNGATRTSA